MSVRYIALSVRAQPHFWICFDYGSKKSVYEKIQLFQTLLKYRPNLNTLYRFSCLPSTIVCRHFSHFSFKKTFSFPASNISDFIAGSIHGTRARFRFRNISLRASIAAPVIFDLKFPVTIYCHQ